ncbi:Hypothetical predicted protein [Mytilus galloprovincialis]|uniref:Uncharacterized protein n=1 Tax=Mytilus galloprovincialis TaxID=29158 RepID=A0A8B6DSN9_MYTGA|nr:Hypothetical predicted protein [Mytilus galloprovincialis]
MLFILYARTPLWMNFVAGPIISYLSIVMNIIIFVALFHKNIRTPSTVLMQGLALTDGLTALCTYGFEPLFILYYEEIGTSDDHSIIDVTTIELKRRQKTSCPHRFAACLDDIPYFLDGIPNFINSDESCISDFDQLPSHFKANVTRNVDSLALYIEDHVHGMLDGMLKGSLKQKYFDYLVDLLADERIRYANELKDYVKQILFDIVAKSYCNATENVLNPIMKKVYFVIVRSCLYTFDDRYESYLILGSSPYSEPMNYIVNIVWGHIDITLEYLKLLIEVLKLLMIIGCASNFLIYIVMSEKLREALKQTFKCRENPEERVHVFQMQTREETFGTAVL